MIKNVIIPFPWALESDARLLQQIVLYDAAFDHPFRVEANLHEFPEAAGVVVSNGFCVP